MGDHNEVVGKEMFLLLPEFMTTGSCPRDFMKGAGRIRISKSAEEVIGKHRVVISNRRKRQLALIKGADIKQDCYLPEIKSLAKVQGWTDPSVEDALSLPKVISPEYLISHNIKWIVVVHQPASGKGGNYLLGLEVDVNGMTLFARSANPHHKWFARDGGFVFLLP